jgi:hypothetical protein
VFGGAAIRQPPSLWMRPWSESVICVCLCRWLGTNVRIAVRVCVCVCVWVCAVGRDLTAATARNRTAWPSFLLHILGFCVCMSVYSDWLRAGRSGDGIPVGTKFSAPVQTGPGAHPASCTMGTGSFPGVKRPERGASPPPSSTEANQRVKLYLYALLHLRPA